MSQITPTIILKNQLKSTWYFSCKNVDEQKEFESFERADMSLTTFLIFLAIFTGLLTYYKLGSFNRDPSIYNLASLMSGFIFTIYGFSLLGMLYHARYICSDEAQYHFIKLVTKFESSFAMIFHVSVILTFFSILNENHHDELPCNDHKLPEAIMSLMLVFPFLISIVVKSLKSEVVFLSWAIYMLVIAGALGTGKYGHSVGSFVVVAMISLLKLCEFQRQKISMFFLSRELQGVQDANERLEKENRASELKHLIGNVAHDLKTVSVPCNFPLVQISLFLSLFRSPSRR
jgi:hypothetical protein